MATTLSPTELMMFLIALPLWLACLLLWGLVWAALRQGAQRRRTATRDGLAPIARGTPGPLYDASTGPRRDAPAKRDEREAEVV